MKRIFFLCILQYIVIGSFSQSVGINNDGSAPDASSILDVKSTDKGMLVPRLSTAQRTAISSPAHGLLVFDTNTSSFWYHNGSVWTSIGGAWSLNGNAGNNPSQFIGTTDNMPLIIKTNDQFSGVIHSQTPFNTSWGYQALLNNDNNIGIRNTAIGFGAMEANTNGRDNTATGHSALSALTTGDGNTAIGYQALQVNTSGSTNTAIGYRALQDNVGGSNVAVGTSALFDNTTGVSNTAVGVAALSANITGMHNTAIGNSTNTSTSNLSNATAIGYNAIVNASNKVRIGNATVTSIEGQVPFTSPSDGRFKYEVKENVKGLDFILQLRPVTYRFDVKKFDQLVYGKVGDNTMQEAYTKASAIRRTGFIAQEVEQVALKAGYDFSGIIKPQSASDHYSLSYESFVVPLVKAVQELSVKVEKLETENQQIEELKNAVRELQLQLKELKENKTSKPN